MKQFLVVLNRSRKQFVSLLTGNTSSSAKIEIEERVALVTGGHTYQMILEDFKWFEEMLRKYKITLVRHGGADGVDSEIDRWCKANFYRTDPHPVTPEEWNRHRNAKTGKSYAGMLRNKKMAELEPIPKVCIAFTGAKGTLNMIETARKKGIPVEESPERFITAMARAQTFHF